MGKPLSPDGKSARWTVTQAVFKRIPYHMELLYKSHGKKKIEFDENYMANERYRAVKFPSCRILDESVFEDLRAALIDDFLNARLTIDFVEIAEWEKPWLKKMLSEKEIDTEEFLKINKYEPAEQNTILILSGLLRLEVLKLALMKRWRVNFGVDPNGKRKMAVPFRAKDVASEMTGNKIKINQISEYHSAEPITIRYEFIDFQSSVIQTLPSALLSSATTIRVRIFKSSPRIFIPCLCILFIRFDCESIAPAVLYFGEGTKSSGYLRKMDQKCSPIESINSIIFKSKYSCPKPAR